MGVFNAVGPFDKLYPEPSTKCFAIYQSSIACGMMGIPKSMTSFVQSKRKAIHTMSRNCLDSFQSFKIPKNIKEFRICDTVISDAHSLFHRNDENEPSVFLFHRAFDIVLGIQSILSMILQVVLQYLPQ